MQITHTGDSHHSAREFNHVVSWDAISNGPQDYTIGIGAVLHAVELQG